MHKGHAPTDIGANCPVTQSVTLPRSRFFFKEGYALDGAHDATYDDEASDHDHDLQYDGQVYGRDDKANADDVNDAEMGTLISNNLMFRGQFDPNIAEEKHDLSQCHPTQSRSIPTGIHGTCFDVKDDEPSEQVQNPQVLTCHVIDSRDTCAHFSAGISSSCNSVKNIENKSTMKHISFMHDTSGDGCHEDDRPFVHCHLTTCFHSLISRRTTDSSDDVVEVPFVDDLCITDTLYFPHDDRDSTIIVDGERTTEQAERKDCNTIRAAPESCDLATVATQQAERMSTKHQLLDLADDWIRRKLQYVYAFAMLYATPVCIALYAPTYAVSTLYYLSIVCVVFVNFWILLEVASSFQFTSQLRKLHHSSSELRGERKLGSIVAAFLPNELTVLIDTVRAVANTIHELPKGTTLDIVVVHNGGGKEQRVALLEDLMMIESELPYNVCVHELNVLSSRSKAENVNAAIDFFEELGAARGKSFTQLSMYDADHQPISQAWRYALETMQDQQADMVMGRCCVRDGLKYVAIEFDILYAVAHAGGRCIRGFGFFGGSNGYWDYKTLVETGMDEGMLTEDVDASFRALANGHRMTYDSTIVSFEESPPDFLALFKQRLRWAQGWYEVTIRQFSLPFRQAPGLTLWSRFCIFLLLPFRELYVYLSSFTVPIAVVYLARSCGWDCVDYRLFALMVFCFHVPVLLTVSAWYLKNDRLTFRKVQVFTPGCMI